MDLSWELAVEPEERNDATYLHKIMAARIKPQDLRHVDAALNQLSWDNVRQVALRLGVPQNRLSDIEMENPTSTSGRKLRAMDCWLQSDIEASWEKLVDILKSLSITSTAQEIEEKYCSRSASSTATSRPPDTCTSCDGKGSMSTGLKFIHTHSTSYERNFFTAELSLSGMPSLAQLQRLKTFNSPDICIIELAAPKWDTIATMMDFDPKGSKLDAIRSDYSTVQQRCRETFKLWLDGKGKRQPATWSTLLEILEDCDLSDLAGNIREVLD